MQYKFDFLEVLSDLPEPHGGVGEDLLLLHLLVEYFCEDHLEGHRNTCLFQILLEHLGLLSLFRCLVVYLHLNRLTSYYSRSDYSF